MNVKAFFATLSAAVLISGVAAAQTAGIGTTNTAYTFQAGGAISKVVSSKTDFQLRVQPFGGSSVYVPMASSGQLEFALANEFETHSAVTGTGIYKDRPQPGLQVAAVLTPFQSGVWAREGSGIKTAADLKGKRVPAGYASQKIIEVLMKGVLANAGLTYDDVQQVPVPNVVKGAEDFAAGRIDVFFFAFGAAAVQEANAKTPIQYVTIDNSPEAVKRMRQHVPPSYAMKVTPQMTIGVMGDNNYVMAYDYLLLASKEASPDLVYATVKAMAENKDELASSFPALRNFDPNKMAKKMEAATFHEGAIRYYKESNQWPPKE